VKSATGYLELLVLSLLIGAFIGGCASSGSTQSTNTGGGNSSTSAFGNKNVPKVCSKPVSDVNTDLAEKQELGDIHLQLGVGYMMQDKLNTALAEMNEAIELMPSSATAYSALALLEIRMNRIDDARKSYKRALRLEPGDPELNNNYGHFLCQQGEYLAADKRFQCALANPLYKTPWRAYYNGGICALKAGELKQADIYLRTTRQLRPDLPQTLYYLADLSYQRGGNLQAADYLKRYHESVTPEAESLWLGVQIARKLNDQDMEASYTMSLKNLFPDSDQAQMLYTQ